MARQPRTLERDGPWAGVQAVSLTGTQVRKYHVYVCLFIFTDYPYTIHLLTLI